MVSGAGGSSIANGIQFPSHNFSELVGHNAKEVEGARGDAVRAVKVEGRSIAKADASIRGRAVVRDDSQGHFLGRSQRPAMRAGDWVRTRQACDCGGVVRRGAVIGERSSN